MKDERTTTTESSLREAGTQTLRFAQGDRWGVRTRDLLLPHLLSGQVAIGKDEG